MQNGIHCLSEMKKGTTWFTIVIGDFNAKVGEMQMGERSEGNFGIGSRNSRGDTLMRSAERNNLRLIEKIGDGHETVPMVKQKMKLTLF